MTKRPDPKAPRRNLQTGRVLYTPEQFIAEILPRKNRLYGGALYDVKGRRVR